MKPCSTRPALEHAKGLIAAWPLTADRDNLVITFLVQQKYPDIRIGACCSDEAKFSERMLKTGVDLMVSPNRIGALRLASEVLRPHVVQFLDAMVIRAIADAAHRGDRSPDRLTLDRAVAGASQAAVASQSCGTGSEEFWHAPKSRLSGESSGRAGAAGWSGCNYYGQRQRRETGARRSAAR
jgi:hypothetical protein